MPIDIAVPTCALSQLRLATRAPLSCVITQAAALAAIIFTAVI
jgi:hypothetical protein